MTKGTRVYVRRQFGGRARGRAVSLALALGVWMLDATLAASVVVPMSLAELTREATTIVDGIVAEVRATEGPAGTERLVLVRVSSTWKGQPDETLYVHLPGGRLGRTETVVSGAPLVEPGDRVVWFLDPHPRGGYVVLGLHQGALRAQPGTSGELLVMAPPAGAGSRGDRRRLPRRLDDLAADVRVLLAGEAAR